MVVLRTVDFRKQESEIYKKANEIQSRKAIKFTEED